MGWAARTHTAGTPKAAGTHPARPEGARVLICAHCKGHAGGKRQRPLVYVGTMLGQKIYAHDACLKAVRREAKDA